MHLSELSLQYPYRVNQEIHETKNKRHMAHIESYTNPETKNKPVIPILHGT